MGDEAPPEDRLRLLDELEADLGRLYRGLGAPAPSPGGGAPEARSPLPGGAALPAGRGRPGSASSAPWPRLSRSVTSPRQPFADLIQANRQDQVVTRYATAADLFGYCELSANPVGRIVLHVFGAFTPERAVASDRVCTALQLAEHWQDVAEDLRAGRVYLPAQDMERFGCTEADLAAATAAPQVRALMAFEVQRARRLLDEGAPLVGNLHGAARVAVAGYVAGRPGRPGGHLRGRA